MIKTTTQILIEKIEKGEKVTCPKCKKGIVVYELKPEYKCPSIYCNNPNSDAKIMID